MEKDTSKNVGGSMCMIFYEILNFYKGQLYIYMTKNKKKA